jgi:hypothetical protein
MNGLETLGIYTVLVDLIDALKVRVESIAFTIFSVHLPSLC